jgi:hypothetical protein
MKPLITPRYDPLIWCGACCLISVITFWWPLATMYTLSDNLHDFRRGYIQMTLLASPIYFASGIRALFAFRRLVVARHTINGKLKGYMIALGGFFTIGAALPAILLLVAIVSFFIARTRPDFWKLNNT